MKRNAQRLAILITVLFFPSAQAADDPEHLIQSCKELVDIYAKRDQRHLFAAATTSLSEALRAGYCKGVVDEYRRRSECATNNWYTQAQRISATLVSSNRPDSVDELLEISCEI